MGFLFTVHSWLRWIIVALAVIAVIRFILVWIGKLQSGAMDRGLMSGFVGLMDLQLLLGIILLIGLGGMPRYRIEHGVTMLLAVILGHISAKWKNSPGPLRARNYLLILLGVLVLIIAGVMRLPQGWFGGMAPAV